jgi:phosphoglycolate phosphatase
MSPHHKPKAIIFDWDNTLVNTWPKLMKSINGTLEKFDLEQWTLEEVKQRTHKSCKDSFPILFGKDAKEAADYFYYLYRERFGEEQPSPIEGAESLLETIQRYGIKAGIVSNKEGETLRKEVKLSNWEKYFGSILGSRDTEKDKPHPLPVIKTLEALNLAQCNDIWFIGDTIVDLECANAANCHPILFGDKVAAPGHENLEYAFSHFETLDQFSDYINKIHKPI